MKTINVHHIWTNEVSVGSDRNGAFTITLEGQRNPDPCGSHDRIKVRLHVYDSILQEINKLAVRELCEDIAFANARLTGFQRSTE